MAGDKGAKKGSPGAIRGGVTFGAESREGHCGESEGKKGDACELLHRRSESDLCAQMTPS